MDTVSWFCLFGINDNNFKTERMLVHLSLFCNRNKGSESQRLKYCDFAGWDSEEQFTVVTVSTSPNQRQKPVHKNLKESSEKQVGDAKEVERENGAMQTDTVLPHDARKEREVEISPGERVSVVIACKAK